jgi:hypothetical protein
LELKIKADGKMTTGEDLSFVVVTSTKLAIMELVATSSLAI